VSAELHVVTVEFKMTDEQAARELVGMLVEVRQKNGRFLFYNAPSSDLSAEVISVGYVGYKR
jgi:hypothetical protein